MPDNFDQFMQNNPNPLRDGIDTDPTARYDYEMGDDYRGEFDSLYDEYGAGDNPVSAGAAGSEGNGGSESTFFPALAEGLGDLAGAIESVGRGGGGGGQASARGQGPVALPSMEDPFADLRQQNERLGGQIDSVPAQGAARTQGGTELWKFVLAGAGGLAAAAAFAQAAK